MTSNRGKKIVGMLSFFRRFFLSDKFDRRRILCFVWKINERWMSPILASNVLIETLDLPVDAVAVFFFPFSIGNALKLWKRIYYVNHIRRHI